MAASTQSSPSPNMLSDDDVPVANWRGRHTIKPPTCLPQLANPRVVTSKAKGKRANKNHLDAGTSDTPQAEHVSSLPWTNPS